jgi:hypothetical protein
MNPTLDPGLLALVVHDLRNPLNVIALMLPMLEAGLASDEGRDDLGVVAHEVENLRSMLELLGDFSAGLTYPDRGSRSFDPRSLLAELVEAARSRDGADPARITLAADDAPAAVTMMDYLARTALEKAITNAVRAAGTATVHVEASGAPDRWITRITIAQSPPASLTAGSLHSRTAPRRLLSSPDERLALDLILAAHISERLGGSARMELEPGRSSTVVLDWPAGVA